MPTVPAYLRHAHIGHPGSFAPLAQALQATYPGYTIEARTLDGTLDWLTTEGVAFAWLAAGEAEVAVAAAAGAPATDQGWQTLAPGDVVVIDTHRRARARGNAHMLQITSTRRTRSRYAGLHRLADLPDLSGGCNVGENAFRRLQITWSDEDCSPADPDGDNLLGCHVVFIAEATSRTHYHPVPPRPGGMLQHELYLVLDPHAHGLHPGTTASGVWTYPEPGNWRRYDFTPLQPGDVLSIPAGVAHRGIDILACVIAIPGFKPGNDSYVDHLIAESGADAPYNAAFAAQ